MTPPPPSKASHLPKRKDRQRRPSAVHFPPQARPPPPPLCDIPLGCRFFTGPWTVTCSSVASGRCVLSAAAAGAPAGVVSAFTEPSGWCAGAVLDVAGCAVCVSAAPSGWRTGGCAGRCRGRLTILAAHAPPPSGRPQAAALHPPRPPLSDADVVCWPLPQRPRAAEQQPSEQTALQ